MGDTKMKIVNMSFSELNERITSLKESQKKEYNPYRQVNLDKLEGELKRRQGVTNDK